jgi:hypothetical protein
MTLYEKADEKIAGRAITRVQREKHREFHLTDFPMSIRAAAFS